MSWPDHIRDIIDDFAFLEDWESRYTHVIEMGKALAPLDDAEYSDAHKVKGCVSQVWLVSEPGPDRKLTFRGDSDAHIVKGLVALVIRIYSGQKAADIVTWDAGQILKEMGLGEHLSPQRSNGLGAMVQRIKRDAQALTA